MKEYTLINGKRTLVKSIKSYIHDKSKTEVEILEGTHKGCMVVVKDDDIETITKSEPTLIDRLEELLNE